MLKINPSIVHKVLLICAEVFETGKYPNGKVVDSYLEGLCHIFGEVMIQVSSENYEYAEDDLWFLFTQLYRKPSDPFHEFGASYSAQTLDYVVRARESRRMAEYVRTQYMEMEG